MRTAIGFCCCACLTVVVAITCARIEYLNYRVGGYLPRADFGSGNQKWRIASERAIRNDVETRIRRKRLEKVQRISGQEDNGEDIYEKPLSAEEYAAIEARVESEMKPRRIKSNLHEWVSTMGLLQYLLAPIALVWALHFMFSRVATEYRLGGIFLAAVAAGSVGMMFYRAYYTSLGW